MIGSFIILFLSDYSCLLLIRTFQPRTAVHHTQSFQTHTSGEGLDLLRESISSTNAE